MPLLPTTSSELNARSAHAEDDSQVREAEADQETRAQRTLVRNRRMRYLDLHPEYFNDANREIADPLLYDRLVRRFMSREERGQQDRHRGFADALEASIVRSEAKLHAVNHPDPQQPMVYVQERDGTLLGLERDPDRRAQNKEDGWARWTEHITERFVQGLDHDFDYRSVDDNEEYDDRAGEDRGKLEEYLDDEEEEFVGEGALQGETGVQDF